MIEMQQEMKRFQQENIGGGGIMKQNQQQQNRHQHLAQAAAVPQQQPPPPAQPQKCPRCDSLNTKFCYYNNYSLSQPRYFCKTCRRYWTQGGTLRNVPVGGGCRKGKRLKKPSSSSDNNHHNHQSAQSASNSTVVDSSLMKPINPLSSSSSLSPFNFPGGGFLSSLAAIQSFNGEFGGSNLALLQGFAHNNPNPSFYFQQPNLQFHQTPPQHVFNLSSSNNREGLEENGIQPSIRSSPTSQQDWPPPQAGFWSNTTTNAAAAATTTTTTTTTTTISNNCNDANTNGDLSLNMNQTHHWVDLQGYGAPPSGSSSPPSFL